MVRPDRFERPTYWFVASCSIQLSYGRTYRLKYTNSGRGGTRPGDERRLLGEVEFHGPLDVRLVDMEASILILADRLNDAQDVHRIAGA